MNINDVLEFFKLFSPIFALLAIIISFLTYKMNKKNQKLAYFDRRYQIFIDSQYLYQEYHDGVISRDTFRKFICSMHASKLLFPEKAGISKFLDSIHTAAVSYNGITKNMKIQTDPNILEDLRKRREESCLVLDGFLQELSSLMSPYTKVY